MLIIGNKSFDTDNNYYIMGILNVTPDSFSDGGKFNSIDAALKRVESMVNDGADIIDIGAESTRPSYDKISDEEEISRLLPVLKRVKEEFDIPISVDTYKSKVALAALDAGADMINDIWGFKYDKNIAEYVKKYDASVCLMHNKKEANYDNFVSDVIEDLKESIDIASEYGISDDKICIDPGVGFAKSFEQNLEIIREVSQLEKLGYPILLGTSRKSVIGLALDLPVDEREEGTLATTIYGALNGCSIFRVHDVKANYRALKMISKLG